MESTIAAGKHQAQHIKMTGSRFNDVCLGNAEFENVSLVRAKMHDINLCEMDVSYFRMNGTKFHHGWAQQSPVSFEACDLSGAIFKGCKLTNVELSGCDVSGMKIDGILVKDMLVAHKRKGKRMNGGRGAKSAESGGKAK